MDMAVSVRIVYIFFVEILIHAFLSFFRLLNKFEPDNRRSDNNRADRKTKRSKFEVASNKSIGFLVQFRDQLNKQGGTELYFKIPTQAYICTYIYF